MTPKERELLYAIGEGVGQLLYDSRKNTMETIATDLYSRLAEAKAEPKPSTPYKRSYVGGPN